MECQKVRSKDAAKLLGMSLSRMHALMDRKQLDIGVVLQPLPGRKSVLMKFTRASFISI